MSRRGIERVKGIEPNVAGQARERASSTQQAATSPPRSEVLSGSVEFPVQRPLLGGPLNATRRNAISSTSRPSRGFLLTLHRSESFLSTSGQPLSGDIRYGVMCRVAGGARRQCDTAVWARLIQNRRMWALGLGALSLSRAFSARVVWALAPHQS